MFGEYVYTFRTVSLNNVTIITGFRQLGDSPAMYLARPMHKMLSAKSKVKISYQNNLEILCLCLVFQAKLSNTLST